MNASGTSYIRPSVPKAGQQMDSKAAAGVIQRKVRLVLNDKADKGGKIANSSCCHFGKFHEICRGWMEGTK